MTTELLQSIERYSSLLFFAIRKDQIILLREIHVDTVFLDNRLEVMRVNGFGPSDIEVLHWLSRA